MNTRTRQKRLAEINKAINDQLKWMDSCGRDRAGYLFRYACCGRYSMDEANAIYDADKAQLDKLIEQEKQFS